MSRKLNFNEVVLRLRPRNIIVVEEGSCTRSIWHFECINKHRWSTKLINVLRGTGCPKCSGVAKVDRLEANIRLFERGLCLLENPTNTTKKVNFKCDKGHLFNSRLSSVLDGIGCPFCSGSNPMTSETLTKALIGRGISFSGAVHGGLRKIDFKCDCGNTWSARPSDVTRGGGCPRCAKGGFDKRKRSHFYVFLAQSLCDSFVGFGISNDVKTRITSHKKTLSDAGYIVLNLVKFQCSGEEAYRLEKLVKNAYAIPMTELVGFKTEATLPVNYLKVVEFAKLYLGEVACEPH